MRFKYIIGTIAIIVLTSAGLLVFGINTLLDRNKDAIISEMERYTGRRISLSGITTSFTDGIGVQLDEFSSGDDQRQAVGHFLKADRLKLNFSLSSLYSDQPEIREAILYRPTINVKRNSDGIYNFGVLPSKGTGDSESDGTAPETAKQTPKVSLLVSLLEISEGTIHYTDELTDSSVTITSIGLQGRDLDFDQISHMQLEAAIHSATPNVSLSLDAGPLNSNLNGLDGIPVTGTIRIQQVNLNKLRQSFPFLANINTAIDSFAGPLHVIAGFAGTPGEISLTGVQATLSYPKAGTANLTISGDVGPFNLQHVRLEPECNIDLTMRLTALEFGDISESWGVTELLSDSTQDNGGAIDFVLSAKGTPKELVLTGLLDATGMSLKVENYFVKPAEVSLTLNSRAVVSGKTLRTNKLELNLGPLTLLGTGYLTLDDQKQINFDFSSNEIDLDSLRPFLPFIMRTNATGKASAKFNTAFLSAGVSGDFGGTWTLPRIVGPSKARELYMLSERFTAGEAERLGLVARAVPDDELMTTVKDVAQKLSKSAPLALRRIKANFNDSERVSFSEALDLEADRHTRCSLTEDATEAANAFMEKREPQFNGR